jgi:putative membrane protein
MNGRRLTLTLIAFALATPVAAQNFIDPLRRALPAPEYARRAAANDLYQRQAAQLILRSSRNPDIRKLAQTLIADHARTAADLRTAAAKAGIKVDATRSTTELSQMIGKLTLATADNRDTLFLAQQRSVHQRALAMHQDYAKGGDNPDLKDAAARTAAIEQGHLDLIDSAAMQPIPQPTALHP